MRTVLTVATAVVVLLVGVRLGDDSAPSVPAAGEAPRVEQQVPPPPEPSAGALGDSAAPLLRAAAHGDGDSWRDTTGDEYRLGLVNAPEQGECFGAEATAERQRLVARGFRADVYSVDRYGRGVAVVTTADGTNLNVHLARHGFVDDRYLADFRHEHPELASDLEQAFTDARAHDRGLWSACAGATSPVAPVARAPAAAGCHPDYATCVPVAGDGSGTGGGNDLDCGDVRGPVRARQPGVDPYRLDADGDGLGCDTP